MTERQAAMSAEAAALYQQLRDAGLEIPERATLPAWRIAVRDGFEAYVQAAVSAFDGGIEMIEIAGTSCRRFRSFRCRRQMR